VKRTRVWFVVVAILLVMPAGAVGHRRATRKERRAILAAVVRQRELSEAQAACQRVTISTVDQDYAALTWPAKPSSACRRVEADGVIVEHREWRRWRFVTVGSSFRCPVKGVPDRVARDLRICP
jgi:hypothetical protein